MLARVLVSRSTRVVNCSTEPNKIAITVEVNAMTL